MAELRSENLPPDMNRGPMVVAISWVSASLAIIVVALRISIRFKKRAHGWDDYIIYTALAVSIYGSILNTLQVKYGFGRHIEYVLPTLTQVAMYTTLVEMQNAIGTFLVKFSVCLFILRLIRRTHHKVRVVLWLTIVILFALTIATLLVLGLQCIPFQKIWNPEMPGSCFSAGVLTQLIRVLGVFGTATDFACVIIPIFIIRGLQLNRRTKNAMIVVLGLGFFTAACGIGKSVTVEIVTPDITYDYVPVEIWALLEENMGVTVACLPVLRPLFVSILKVTTERSVFWPNRYRTDRSRNTARAFDSQKKNPGNIESDREELVPMGNIINVSRTTEIGYVP